MKTKVKTQMLLALLVFASCAWAQQPAAKPTFGIGSTVDQYPAVDGWIRGEPITRFDKDKTYIIECWATWCGPCIVAIPHINKLYQKFKDKIVFVGQAVQDKKIRIVPFVKEQGANMAYPIAYEENREDGNHFLKSWLVAGGFRGIPQTIVIQNNQVVWTPHPSKLSEEILQTLVDRKFDLATAERLDPFRKFKSISDLIGKKEYKRAMSMLDSILEKDPFDPEGLDLKYTLYVLMKEPKEAVLYFKKAFEANPIEKLKSHYYYFLKEAREWELLAKTAKNYLDKNPGDYLSIKALYQALANNVGDPTELVTQLDKAIDMSVSPKTLEMISNISAWEKKVDNLEIERKLFKAGEKSLSIDPDDLDFIYRLVTRAWETNDKNSAIKLTENARDALSKNPSKQKLTNILTELLASLNKDILPSFEQFKKWTKL